MADCGPQWVREVVRLETIGPISIPVANCAKAVLEVMPYRLPFGNPPLKYRLLQETYQDCKKSIAPVLRVLQAETTLRTEILSHYTGSENLTICITLQLSQNLKHIKI